MLQENSKYDKSMLVGTIVMTQFTLVVHIKLIIIRVECLRQGFLTFSRPFTPWPCEKSPFTPNPFLLMC